MRHRAVVAALVVLVGVIPRPARADNAAAAEALFAEGRKMLAEGKAAEACPKFAESQRLDPGAGTLLNLAGCYEAIGRTATAWATYKEAGRVAGAQNRAKWEEQAKKKAAALEPALARLTLRLEDPAAEVTIRRDGQEVGPGELGTAIPVDPGPHVVEAMAAGRAPWKRDLEVAAERTEQVVIPRLAPASASADVAVRKREEHPSAAAEPPAKPGATQRTAGLVVGGVGAAALAVGAVTGVLAISAKGDCEPYPNCGASAEGRDANDRAHSLATVSTIGFVVGVVGVGAGAALFLSAPRAQASTAAARALRGLVPVLDAGPQRQAGLVWRSVW